MAGEYQQAVNAKQQSAQVAQNSHTMTNFKTQISQAAQAMTESKRNSISFQKK
jgi:hypothetical protein